jgi:type VI protein secretion system component VasF
MTLPPETSRPLWQRLLWFIALWAAGVGTVAMVGYGLRLWIAPR